MKTLYHYEGKFHGKLIEIYNSIIEKEFYNGDMDYKNSDKMLLNIKKGPSNPISIINIKSNFGVSLSRRSTHIRSNKSGKIVIWFIYKGECKIIRSKITNIIKEGEVALTRPDDPFRLYMNPIDGHFASTCLIVPEHFIIKRIKIFKLIDSNIKIIYKDDESIYKILNFIESINNSLSDKVSNFLSHALLEAILSNIDERQDFIEKKLSRRESLFYLIKNEIERNLTDPKLNYKDVARNCGISPRYLYYIVKVEGTTFASLVWESRVNKAREWMESPDFIDKSLKEISFMAGFKSSAHFSRFFKAKFGRTPREYRDYVCRYSAS